MSHNLFAYLPSSYVFSSGYIYVNGPGRIIGSNSPTGRDYVCPLLQDERSGPRVAESEPTDDPLQAQPSPSPSPSPSIKPNPYPNPYPNPSPNPSPNLLH